MTWIRIILTFSAIIFLACCSSNNPVDNKSHAYLTTEAKETQAARFRQVSLANGIELKLGKEETLGRFTTYQQLEILLAGTTILTDTSDTAYEIRSRLYPAVLPNIKPNDNQPANTQG